MPAHTEAAARVALVTGAARRIGAAIACELHAAGCRVLLHCHQSVDAANALAAELNARRANTCAVLQADLCDAAVVHAMAADAVSRWGRLDLLVNNASGFTPTPFGGVSAAQWDDIFGSNVKGAFLLSQALAATLAAQRGAIVNVLDVHAELPLRGYAVYGMAKAAAAMMTRALALELGPAVRVNGVAPGAILLPEEVTADAAGAMLGATALGHIGAPADIAGAVRYLGLDAPFVTGQILKVDGGRSLF